MSLLVVDASVTAAWLLDDEDEPRADRALERLNEYGATVPQLWHLEIRNSLLPAERCGRLSVVEANSRLDTLAGLPIKTDNNADFQAAMDLVRQHGLSLYDALYLELAMRERADLTTLDRSLRRAAASEGVRTLGVSLIALTPRIGALQTYISD